MEPINTTRKLNEAQLMLLQVFSRELPPEQMKKLKKILINFYDEVIQEEIERLAAEKNITQKKLDELKVAHPKRKPYQS